MALVKYCKVLQPQYLSFLVSRGPLLYVKKGSLNEKRKVANWVVCVRAYVRACVSRVENALFCQNEPFLAEILTKIMFRPFFRHLYYT